jgi:hypothetical protein
VVEKRCCVEAAEDTRRDDASEQRNACEAPPEVEKTQVPNKEEEKTRRYWGLAPSKRAKTGHDQGEGETKFVSLRLSLALHLASLHFAVASLHLGPKTRVTLIHEISRPAASPATTNSLHLTSLRFASLHFTTLHTTPRHASPRPMPSHSTLAHLSNSSSTVSRSSQVSLSLPPLI